MPQVLKSALTLFLSTALVGAPPYRQPHVMIVLLSGQAELNFAHPGGGTGDLDGSGTVKLSLSPDKGQCCFDFEVEDVSTPPPVIGLIYGAGSNLSGCVPANSGRPSEILSKPGLSTT